MLIGNFNDSCVSCQRLFIMVLSAHNSRGIGRILLFSTGLALKKNVSDILRRAGIDDSSLATRMCKYLISSKSENTVKKYYYSFKKWCDYSAIHNYVSVPAEHIHFAIYLTHLLDTGASVHTISSAVYAIKWAHDINGLADPTSSAFVRNLHESAKRLRGRKTVKKDIVSSEMIIELCDTYIGSSDLIDVRDLCMITLSFAGFLRYDEMSSLRCSDISFSQEYVSINISKCKTDQYRSGSEVVVSKGVSSACPYDMLLRYMGLAGLTKE